MVMGVGHRCLRLTNKGEGVRIKGLLVNKG